MPLPAKMVGMRQYVNIQGEALERLKRRCRMEPSYPRVDMRDLVERLLAEKLEEDEQREQAEAVPA